jgi:hypothetical protein
MDYGEKRGCGPNAESHYESGKERKRWRTRQRSCGVAQISSELLKRSPTPGVLRPFLENRGISKSAQGSVPGVCRVHTSADVFGNLLIEMELNLVVESLG